MTLWLVFALMTGVAVFAVLWPLGRRAVRSGGSDIVVYRDQLSEIDRDRASGLIGAGEAEAAKVEVSRRLIAAADAAEAEKSAGGAKSTPEAASDWRRRAIATAIAGLVLLPVGSVALYLTLGSPQMPGEPLAARLRAPGENQAVASLVTRVEDHVRQNPNDGRAWEVLAPVYMQLGRFDEAAAAWHNVIALNGPSAEREADYGEAMVAAANGVVTAEAKAAFDRSLALDPKDVMALFYTGMAADQDGRRTDAEKIWRDLLAGAPAGAPWVAFVRHALERNAPPGGPTTATAATEQAPAASAPGEHDIPAMVERLAERLKKDGSDANGWAQLVRSYRVLGQADKAQAALADAQKALAGDPGKLSAFTAAIEGATRTATAAAPMAPAAMAPAGMAPSGAPPGPTAAEIAAAQKLNPDQQQQMIGNMVERLAERLKKDGSDVHGWVQLVRSYRVLGQADKAQAAIADAQRALAGDPDKLAQFAQGTGGAAPAPLAPAAPMAPAGMALSGAPPGPSAAEIAAAAQMKPDAQNQMIRSMVARLADKLKQDGSDVEGWGRLLRAYVVLGERDKAQAAAADARKALAGDPDKLRRLEEAIKGLGLQS
jgi:cytochrome c-type biogenesis protein CcmH